jgi:hypothetical protein
LGFGFTFFPLLIPVHIVGGRTHWRNLEWAHLNILSLIISAKNLFTNKVTITDFGVVTWTCLCEGHHSTHPRIREIISSFYKKFHGVQDATLIIILILEVIPIVLTMDALRPLLDTGLCLKDINNSDRERLVLT